jgi:positive phototaxis protein PixI
LNTDRKFLSFNLGARDTAVISLQYITEVMQVSLAEICGVPEMPSCVLGIYNWRGEMLWLVDLEDMLGYAPLAQGANSISRMMAIVLQNEGKYLGLLVRQLMDIEWMDVNQIKPPNLEIFSRDIASILQGYFINDADDMIITLDAPAIVQSPMWAVHN